jgi:hypothetical protein
MEDMEAVHPTQGMEVHLTQQKTTIPSNRRFQLE